MRFYHFYIKKAIYYVIIFLERWSLFIENESNKYLVTEIEKYDKIKLSKTQKGILIAGILTSGFSALTILLCILQKQPVNWLNYITGSAGITAIVDIICTKAELRKELLESSIQPLLELTNDEENKEIRR